MMFDHGPIQTRLINPSHYSIYALDIVMPSHGSQIKIVTLAGYS